MRKERYIPYIEVAFLLILSLSLGAVFSCAWIKTKPSDLKSEKSPPTKEEFPEKRDRLKQAYSKFILASIHTLKGDNEKARQYLLEAISEDPDSFYLNKKMALLLQDMKDYNDALLYAQKCIDLDSKDIESRMIIAEIYGLLGNEASALKEYEGILELDPDNQKVRLIISTVHIRRGELKPALEHLKTILQKDPNLVIAHYYMGRIYFELGNNEEAERAYKRTLELNSSMEPALFDLGTLYQTGKKYDEAVEMYQKLISLFPNNLIIRERLINLYYELGQEENAEKQTEELKKRARPGEPGRQALGLIYLKHGKLQESINELDLIVSAWPEDHKSRYYLASAYEEKGEQDKALEHFRWIKEESDHYINAQMHIAYILETQKKYDEAIDVLQKALERKKEKIEIYLMLASIFETKKEYDKALAMIDGGLKMDEKHVDLIFRRGVVLDKSGRKEDCLKQMRKVIEIDSNHADALNYIGYTYAEQGIRLDEALELIKTALKIKPESGYIIDSLGWVYYQKGLYDEALSSLEKAISLIPNDPTITEHLGDVYLSKKKYQKALEMYQKALSLNHPQKEKIEEKIKEVKRLLQ
ncbi:MAG: tetratricopeptide repeat protein [Pseudomonadota bacterium]